MRWTHSQRSKVHVTGLMKTAKSVFNRRKRRVCMAVKMDCADDEARVDAAEDCAAADADERMKLQ